MFTPWKKSIMYHVACIMGFLGIILTTSYLLPTVHAQTPTPTASSLPTATYQLPATVSPTSPIYTDLIVHNMFHTFSCLAVGQSMIGQPCLTYQPQKDAQGVIRTVPILSQVDTTGGILGTTSSLITSLYVNPPIRTVDYLASVGKGFGIVKEANAQVVGSGAAVLNPILALWQVSRNIAYVIMVIIFVLIGLMVMFRQKINPQTVISAQAALPGLVLGLILITFSYFFAAFISDAAFISTNLVGYYFSSAQPGSTPKLAEDIRGDNVSTVFGKFVGMISKGDIEGVLQSILNSLDTGVNYWVSFFGAIIAFQTGNSVGGPLGTLAGAGICGAAPLVASGGVAAPLAAIGGPLCGLIGGTFGGIGTGAAFALKAFADPAGTFSWVLYFVAIAIMIYTMFKLLLRLINSYLTIIFLTVTAPFHFLLAALPGRQGIATNWVLNMLSNILAFPAVFAVFYFVAYLWGPGTAPGQLFNISGSPTVAGTHSFPLLGGLDLSFIKILLAFGALVATPTVPDIINKTVGRVSQAGQMIGQEISGGIRSGQGYYGQGTSGIGRASSSIKETGDTWYGRPPGMPVSGVIEKQLKAANKGYTMPEPLKKRIWEP